MSRSVLVVGGTRFVGRLLVARLLARGDRVTIFNRGTLEDPFGDRVERLRGDRTTGDFARLVGRGAGRTFDAAVDFAAYVESDMTAVVEALDVGHYVFISTGQVYLVRSEIRPPSREDDYDGPLMQRPPSHPDQTDQNDASEWDYGVGKRACEDVLLAHPHFRSTRLRIPMVNGPRDHYRRLERYVRRILAGTPLVSSRDSLERRVRHVDAMEVARTIELLLGDPRAFGEAFNQAQDETPTLRELLTMVMRELSLEVPIVEGEASVEESPFSGQWMSFLDPSKIRTLGIDHAPLDRTLARALGHLMGEL